MSEISYNIIRRVRRRTASIIIHADNRIDVLAPAGLSDSHIAAWVGSKQTWIERKLHFNTHTRSRYEAKTFRQDELFALLGREYALCVEPSTKRHTYLSGERLVCHTPAPDRSPALRRQITHWYQQYARQHMQQRVAYYATQTGLSPALVDIKNYRSRWGSCHPDGRIYFNWRIIMAPTHISDYVVVHELCHLQQHNHSPAYWQLVAAIIPEYRTARLWLKVNSLSLDL